MAQFQLFLHLLAQLRPQILLRWMLGGLKSPTPFWMVPLCSLLMGVGVWAAEEWQRTKELDQIERIVQSVLHSNQELSNQLKSSLEELSSSREQSVKFAKDALSIRSVAILVSQLFFEGTARTRGFNSREQDFLYQRLINVLLEGETEGLDIAVSGEGGVKIRLSLEPSPFCTQQCAYLEYQKGQATYWVGPREELKPPPQPFG